MAMVLDAASKLEVTRRCLGEVFEKIEPIRKALQTGWLPAFTCVQVEK